MWRDADGGDDDKSPRQGTVKVYPTRIDEWMRAMDISDREMGELIRKHHNTVYKVRVGDRIATPYEYLIPMAAVLGCKVEDLLLPDKDNLKLFEELRTSKDTPPRIRKNVASALARWVKSLKASEG
jgi:hypothetical protein